MAMLADLSSSSYTSNDGVRGALGLTSRELPDEQLDSMGLGTRLEVDLAGWIPTSGTVTADSFSVDDLPSKTFVLYCSAYCALEVCKRLALLAAVRVSDGKNEVERQPVDFSALEETLRADMRSARRYLEDIINLAATRSTAQTLFNPFAAAASNYNPVTNA